jgi:exoribonuclease II
MLSIIRKYNLPLEFPEAVLAEANRIPDTVDPDRYREREDLRNKFIVTIDPDDARDFDDAINVENLPAVSGSWEFTSPTSPPTSSREARSIAKRSSAGTAFISSIGSSRCCRSV